MINTYHSIFLPFVDIYDLGGPDVFKCLDCKKEDKKNLVVIPTPFIRGLDELKEAHHGGGTVDVLQYLKQFKDYNIDHNMGFSIFEASQGLDIVLLEVDKKAHNKFSVVDCIKKILSIWSAEEPQAPIILTNKEKYHIKFTSRGITVEDPQFLQVSADIVHEGVITGNPLLQEKLHANNGVIDLETASKLLNRTLYINQFIKFVGHGKYEYARVIADNSYNTTKSRIVDFHNARVEFLKRHEYSKQVRVGTQTMDNILGISPLDMEQYLALQYGIYPKDISLFFLCGTQGSGKTLLSYVSTIDMILWYDKEESQKRGMAKRDGFYKKVVLLKPTEIIGGRRRDVGALPGSLYDKIKPHLGPYIDAHRESTLNELFAFDDMLKHPKFANDFGDKRSEETNKKKINGCSYLPPNSEVIELTYSGFMRGRSFRDTILIIDEAQNFTPYEIKTIIARLGEGCKVIIMGDPLQVDNPLCSRSINGLTHTIKHYLDKPYSALVTLTHNYRSQMSQDTDDWKVYSS
ncbi:MAG: PhoH family protein [bacterium]|nr:PhoH family protein [bacterium]MBU1918311.1 PhoH family protein [bacterium]